MNKFLALLFTVSFSFAQFRDIPEVVTKVATSTANWLKLETSARAIGMGGSHVASGRGISGIPYNPGATSGNAWWDMRTVNNQEVAPGLYVFHVKGAGEEKIGKFAVIR